MNLKDAIQIVKKTTKSILLMVLFLGMANVQGQSSWVKTFGGSALDQVEDIISTIDGGYIFVSFSQSFGSGNIYLVKTDIDGNTVWSRNIDEESTIEQVAYSLIELEDQSLILAGRVVQQGGTSNVYLVKLDKTGKELWSQVYEKEGNQIAFDCIATSDNGFVLIGSSKLEDGESQILATKLDADGKELWSQELGDGVGASLVESNGAYYYGANIPRADEGANDNDILLGGIDPSGQQLWQERISTDDVEEISNLEVYSDGTLSLAGYQGSNSDIYVARYDLNGSEIWTKVVDNNGFGDQATASKILSNDILYVVGLTEIDAIDINYFLAEFDPDGNLEWFKQEGTKQIADIAHAVELTLDGGFIIGAASFPVFPPDFSLTDVVLIKTESDFSTRTNRIRGTIVDGINTTCGNDLQLGLPLKGWQVYAEQDNKRYYATTDALGAFEIDVDTGLYDLRIVSPSNVWGLCEENVQQVRFENKFDAVETVQLVVDPLVGAADLRVSISAPFPVASNTVRYDVTYRNEGSTNGEDVIVNVLLDDDVTFLRAEQAPSNYEEGDSILEFRLAEVEVGGIDSTFWFEVTVSENVVLEQAVALEASILEQAVGLPRSPEANLNVTIDKESGRATVTNIGNTISGILNAVVVINDIDFYNRGDNIDPVLPDESITLDTEITPTGDTYRVLVTQQGKGFEGFGSRAIEGFRENTQDNYTTGFWTMFPDDDQEKHIEIDAQEVVGSLESPTMRGYPKGYGDKSIIAQNTDLTFTIFFENEGTDTISRFVIRDTLSDLVDPNTVVPGASNLDYKFEIIDGGIIRITFDSISLLPGSSTVEGLSSGYVKFKVSQKPNLPIGSIIENRAAVYFENEAPKLTNLVTREIGSFPGYIELATSNEETYIEGTEIKVYPNPFNDVVTIELKGNTLFDILTFSIFDLTGKLIESNQYSGNKIMYYRNHKLTSGVYLYKLESEGQLINSGKLLVR